VTTDELQRAAHDGGEPLPARLVHALIEAAAAQIR